MGALALQQETFALTAPPSKGKRAVSHKEEAQHSCESSEWYTPTKYTDPARDVLGVIDLDPASSAAANELVRAVAFYNAANDGLAHEWHGNVWLNPPSPPGPWWKKLVAEYQAGRVTRAVYLAYSIEQLVQIQGWTPVVLETDWIRLCIVDHRIRFLQTRGDQIKGLERRVAKLLAEDKAPPKPLTDRIARLAKLDPAELVQGDQPTHGSAIIGLGIEPAAWRAAFSSLGVCR